VEGVPSKDMTAVGEYLQTWKLKLSTTKAVFSAFHLNKEAKTWAERQPQQWNVVPLLSVHIPRGVTRLVGAWGKKPVCHPHVLTSGL